MSRSGHSNDQGLRLLSDTVSEALRLLEDAQIRAPTIAATIVPTSSLLEECIELCRRVDALHEEPVRTIHHFACTGGTLVSKCVAAMPNVQLLSEIDPLSTLGSVSGKPRFAPTDLLTLWAQGTRPATQADIIDSFLVLLKLTLERTRQTGGYLVLRDHSHSHFCVDSFVRERPTLRELVDRIAPTLSLVTVRDPIDSYTSLVRNRWVHFRPATFEEYCSRYLTFLDAHRALPVVSYEDLVRDPSATMMVVCQILQLPFDETFDQLHSVFTLTGDSGRRSKNIGQRPVREERREYEFEASASPSYHALVKTLSARAPAKPTYSALASVRSGTEPK
jgi:hypothetical protein